MSGRARRDAVAVTVVALLARLLVALWAARTIPATADGTYYHLLAMRLAEGHGYTWLWPDGAVTYAAHYPVGYPGLLAGAYAIFGSTPGVAMVVNALVGTAGAWAAHDLLRGATSRRLALAGGMVAALHPALLPYTAAVMTEGVTAALLVVAAALAGRARESERRRVAWLVACGVVMGAATLVRPQCLVLAPVMGWASAGTRAREAARLGFGLGALGVALLVCAPWTARNCARMDSCALVSVNGGWNLAIGTQTRDGGWQEIVVPDACKEVFAESAKDACFGRSARGVIAAAPLTWLERTPAKLRVTFDYFGAAPWYLHAANPGAFPYRAKLALGTLETIASRVLLLAALVAVRKLDGPRSFAREGVTALGLVSCFVVGGAAVGYLACALAILLLGPRALARAPVVVPITAAVVLATALTHAVFFGAGRYGLVVVPLVAALAFVRPDRAPDVA